MSSPGGPSPCSGMKTPAFQSPSGPSPCPGWVDRPSLRARFFFSLLAFCAVLEPSALHRPSGYQRRSWQRQARLLQGSFESVRSLSFLAWLMRGCGALLWVWPWMAGWGAVKHGWKLRWFGREEGGVLFSGFLCLGGGFSFQPFLRTPKQNPHGAAAAALPLRPCSFGSGTSNLVLGCAAAASSRPLRTLGLSPKKCRTPRLDGWMRSLLLWVWTSAGGRPTLCAGALLLPLCCCMAALVQSSMSAHVGLSVYPQKDAQIILTSFSRDRQFEPLRVKVLRLL